MTSNCELYIRALRLSIHRLRIKIGEAKNANDVMMYLIRELELEMNFPAEPEDNKDPNEAEKFFSSKFRVNKYFKA